MLRAAEFQKLADVPPEVEWFANLTNANTRRAYENAVKDFMRFAGIARPEEFRTVTRAHVIAWRDDLRTRVTRRGEGWSDASIRQGLSALAALFEYLYDRNAVAHNPVKGVARPKSESGEGKTPALGDHQARKLLDAPTDDSIRGSRDRAILSTLLFHALRRDELCKLKVRDFRHTRKGVPHLKVSGKGGKNRYLPIPALMRSFMNTLSPPATARTTAAHCSGRSATTRPASSTRRSRRTASISWCALTRPSSGLRSARMRCARPLPPMRSITTPTSPRCRNGLATPTSPPRASTITAGRGRRTARLSRLLIDEAQPPVQRQTEKWVRP
jgi:Phage integrase, N-terminal SAM-like domain/Phage integrase family